MSAIVALGSPLTTVMSAALPTFEGADARALAEEVGAVLGLDVNRLERREARLDQQLHLALIAEPGDGAAVTGRIETGEQRAAGLDERHFEVHRSPQPRRPALIGARSRDQVVGLRERRQHVQKRGISGSRPGTPASATGSVESIATFLFTRYLIRSWICGESISGFALVAGARRAFVRLFARHEVGARADAVLEAVDAEIGRFAERHRAEMPGHLQPARVRRADRGAELRAGDVACRP